MQPSYHVALPEQLYQRLQTIARSHGKTIEKLVQETLEEVVDEEADLASPQASVTLQPLPHPHIVLPPPGSIEEDLLRQKLAIPLRQGVSLSQIVIDDRGER